LDKFWHQKYIEITEGITRVDGNVAAIDFPDDSFDVVTCQEVLEHLPEEIFSRAIEELRRVCRGQLIITVPCREPEPIPKFHLRRFEDEDLARLFPHADFALLRRPRRPWIFDRGTPQRARPPDRCHRWGARPTGPARPAGSAAAARGRRVAQPQVPAGGQLGRQPVQAGQAADPQTDRWVVRARRPPAIISPWTDGAA
jgi:hypothetical protein